MRRVCALEGCEEEFEARVHNQRFHDKSCCRTYTNARILEQYHLKRKRVMTGRICTYKKCDVKLSQYNDGDLCAMHERQELVAKWKRWGITVPE